MYYEVGTDKRTFGEYLKKQLKTDDDLKMYIIQNMYDISHLNWDPEIIIWVVAKLFTKVNIKIYKQSELNKIEAIPSEDNSSYPTIRICATGNDPNNTH